MSATMPDYGGTGVVLGPYQAFHINSSGIYQIAGSSTPGSSTVLPVGGWLHTITVNNLSTAAQAVQLTVVRDGSTMAVIDTTHNLSTLHYDVGFSQWLTITAVSSSGFGADVTVIWAPNKN